MAAVTDIFIEIEDYMQEQSSPERILFMTVILQALLDASKPSTTNESERAKLDRTHAQAWFFASVGVTSEDFTAVCDMAGIDAGYTRSFAYKVIRSKEVEYTRKKINSILSNI